MKRSYLLLLLLTCAASARAQTSAPEKLMLYTGRYTVTGQFAPMYATLADTTAVARRAIQGERVSLRGLSPTWAKVYQMGKTYYIRKRYLNVPGALVLTPEADIFPRDPATGLISYVGEGTASGTQAELLSRAQVWFATTLRAKDVLQVQDAAGTLVGKASSEVFIDGLSAVPNRLEYTIQLTCRDGRYRYVISSFGYDDTNVAVLTADNNTTNIRTTTSTPAERLVFATRLGGQQSGLVMQHKGELYRVARELQSQLKAAMSKPVGL